MQIEISARVLEHINFDRCTIEYLPDVEEFHGAPARRGSPYQVDLSGATLFGDSVQFAEDDQDFVERYLISLRTECKEIDTAELEDSIEAVDRFLRGAA